MIDNIKKKCGEITNNPSWDRSYKPLLINSGTAVAVGSLANRFWITTNQLMDDSKSRDHVFSAMQRFLTLSPEQKNVSVDNFITATRACAIVLTVVTVAFASKAVMLLINLIREKKDDLEGKK